MYSVHARDGVFIRLQLVGKRLRGSGSGLGDYPGMFGQGQWPISVGKKKVNLNQLTIQ